ncbi:hypothetical protein HDU97_002974 [Phlyctochytrium planicorne]|nr:hypothetical protein HDU97_002974 [Phlyctochytrium planicorne]
MAVLHCIAMLANRLVNPMAKLPKEASDMLTHLINKVTVQQLNVQLPPVDPIEYYNIYSSENLTICIFVLRKGAVMPVHDHPSMTVYSKIVSGDLHFKTFEFLPTAPFVVDPTSNTKGRYARIEVDRVIAGGGPDSLLVIDPAAGANLHSFTAMSDNVVMLDIIGPPYNDIDRHCTYFREIPLNSSSLAALHYASQTPSTPTSTGKSASRNARRRKRKSKSAVARPSDSKATALSNGVKAELESNRSSRDKSPGSEAAKIISNLHVNDTASTSTPSPDESSEKMDSGDDSSNDDPNDPARALPPSSLSSSTSSFASDLDLAAQLALPPSPYLEAYLNGTQKLTWLQEDEALDHNCTERLYTGQRVVPTEIVKSEAAKDLDVMNFAASVIAFLRKVEIQNAVNAQQALSNGVSLSNGANGAAAIAGVMKGGEGGGQPLAQKNGEGRGSGAALAELGQ